ncbi:hypothetical protein DXG01_015057, partial [Tephrocybe rancida]
MSSKTSDTTNRWPGFPSPVFLSSPIRPPNLPTLDPRSKLHPEEDIVEVSGGCDTVHCASSQNGINDPVGACETNDNQGPAPNMVPSVPRTRKTASGIGLGLPSVLCRPNSSERTSQLVSIDAHSPPSKILKQPKNRHISDPISQTSAQSLDDLVGLGILSDARQFFRTYPKRRLYNIPEHISPKFYSKTFNFGRRPSPRTSRGLPPAAPELSRSKQVHPPFLDAHKRPFLWLNNSPTTG